MKLRSIFLSGIVLAMAGCGDDEGEVFAIESGTYAVSSATLASSTDECGLLGAYTDPSKVIGITVSGSAVTFNLSNDAAAPAESLPTASLAENTLAKDGEANYTVAFGTTCVTRIRRDVVGELTADNTAALTLSFSVTTESGTCDGTNTSFSAVPCASAYHFIATKQ